MLFLPRFVGRWSNLDPIWLWYMFFSNRLGEKQPPARSSTVRWLSLAYWFELQKSDQVAGLEARIIGIAEDSTAEADGLGIGKSEDI